MAGTLKRLVGPVALTTTLTTNVFNASSALIYSNVRHIHVVNKTAGAVTFSLWLGTSGGNAAGTELFNGYSVAANSTYDWYGLLRMDSTDFLVGGANTTTALTITVMGEQSVV